MTITVGGFAGAMTEAQWAQANALPPCITTGYTTSAVAGQRAVSVAAGTAIGRGLSVVNDAPIQVNLPTPATTGQWWLIVLRRTYSPGGTAAVLSVQYGSTTSSAVTPVRPPALLPAINQNPGVVEDQPLAFVWVPAATASATVFDMRATFRGDGGLTVPSLQALNALTAAGYFTDGAAVAVAQHAPNPAVGGNLRASAWRLRSVDGNAPYWTPERALQGTSGIVQSLTALIADGTLTRISWNSIGGSFVQDESSNVLFRYVGAGLTVLGAGSPAAFQAWSKPPASFAANWSSGLGGSNVSGSSCFWGISEGQFWMTTWTQYSGAPANTNTTETTITMPSTAMPNQGIGNGSYASAGGSTATDNLVDLMCWVVGTPGTPSNTLRVRRRQASAAGAPVRQNAGLGVSAGTVNDWASVDFRGPSGLAA